MDFSISPELEALRLKTRQFIENDVLPLEADPQNYDDYENISLPVLEATRKKAKAIGLWSPQAPETLGGMGLNIVERAVIYEEANRSIFGPVAINAAAPDDGNIAVMAKIGTQAQKDWFLQPLIDGKVRSAFAMTEPAPGSGSDPTMMLTTATKDGNDWIIKGRKWFITGAAEAAHFILVARTSDDARKGLTAFLFHKDDPGWQIARRIGIMGPEEHGGHCELIFDGLRIPVSSAKLHVAATLHKAVDTAIQLNGARGYSKDTVLEWIYRYARQARLVDGADEVHKMVLARFYGQEGDDFWSWGV